MTISAKVIADSVSPAGIRLTSYQLRYQRFIHAEFMTHRVFTRNASSSRAIPVKRLVQDVLDDPAMPIHWGKNQKGMQADEESDALVGIRGGRMVSAPEAWLEARDNAVRMALAFDEAGFHKQITNRILEPFSHINVLVTSTDWENFLAQRDHKDAQPEMEALAKAMRAAMHGSTPRKLGVDDAHLPYVLPEEVEHFTRVELVKISVARCARVSYLTHDGKAPAPEADLALYDRLTKAEPPHMSPAEHVAYPMQLPVRAANFTGWMSHRFNLENNPQYRSLFV